VKIGSENKKAVRWMIALLAVALLVGIYDLMNLGTSSAAPPPAATNTAAQKNGPQVGVDPNLDPRFRGDLLAASQQVKYQAGRNIFHMEEIKIPAMESSPRGSKFWTVEPAPPPPPTPTPLPPITVKFYGFASKPGEPKRIFLADEGEVFVAKQGDIVERKYKVIQINNTSVIIEDVLNNNRQPIPLTAR
jgi:hypothetical protein